MAGIAVVLLGVMLVRQFGGTATGGASSPRSSQAVLARIDSLQRLVATGEAIAQAYDGVAADFAVRFAEVATYQPDEKSSPAAVERLIRQRLGELGPMTNLTVAAGQAQAVGDGIARVSLDISFTARSDRQALDAMAMFARPETGLAWESFLASGDRRERKVTVTGKLAALLVDPVE